MNTGILFRTCLLASPLVALTFLAPQRAEAAEPFTKEKVQLGVELGYGILLNDGLNGYGFQLGARGGYTLPMNLYLGARFDYFFGEKEEGGFFGSYKANNWGVVPEVGYDVGLTDIIVLRPKLGFGIMRARGCIGDLCTNTVAGDLSFGAELPVSLGAFTLSPEARFNFWLGEGEANALHLGLYAGASF